MMDRKFILMGLGFALLGLLLGLYMGESGNHSQFVTHAHIMLVGFVMSFVYAVLHKLWLPEPNPRLASSQYWLHLVGSVVMFSGLFLLYGQFAEEAVAGPVIGIGSTGVFISLVLMKVMYIKAARQERDQSIAPNEAMATAES